MKYPNINNINFNKIIYEKFKDYRIPSTKKDFDTICFPKNINYNTSTICIKIYKS